MNIDCNKEKKTSLQNNKGILLVVSGAAGTGKGTVNANILKKYPSEYEFSVSATTRPPRPLETDGKEYHFISKEKFEKAISEGDVIEYTKYCGNYYGTLKSELEKLNSGKNLILEIEVEGAMNIKRIYPESVLIFILPPDYETLKSRLVGRGTNTPEDIENRMKKALQEFSFVKDYDYAVINYNGGSEDAADAIVSIVNSEKHKSFRSSKELEALFNIVY